MFAPSAGNSEFVEFLNTSETDNIDLSGFQIKYYTSAPDGIISLSNEYLLKPNQYALIMEADYDFQNGIYKSIIPEDALIFTLDDNSFGSTGMANSSDRKIFLLNSANDTIDSYLYSADNSSGYSDEKVSSIDQVWKNSILFDGTPGAINSVSPKEKDVEIDFANFTFSSTNFGDTINFTVKVKNVGINKCDFTIQLFDDFNLDDQPDNLLEETQIYELETNDSVAHKFIYAATFKETSQQFLIKLNITDDDTINNFKWIKIYPGYERSYIIVNEIMHSPPNDEPEWVEIYNKSGNVLGLFGYKFSDETTTVEILENIFINPNEYFVFVDDSSFFNKYPDVKNAAIINLPSLNNSSDKIIITDSLNRIIDSVEYFSDWGGTNGNSLERIDQNESSAEKSNWGQSTYPTPGFINSISKKEKDLLIDSISILPENYIINDSVKILCRVKNIGKEEVEFYNKLFLFEDSLQSKTLVETSIPGLLQPSDSVIIEFKSKIKVIDSVQNILVKLYADDDDTTNNSLNSTIFPAYGRSAILINEIMFVPQNDEPEWIEIYNNSDYTINLNNWMIGDVLTKPTFNLINMVNYYIEPKEFLVITKDSSIFDYHKIIPSQILISNFANLNNDADGVVIKDNRGITIDSVSYTNEISRNGKSIERIAKNISSVNVNNWSYSVDIDGSTPGRVNSISPKLIDVALISLNSFPQNPIKNQLVNFKLLLKNYGEQTAKDIKVKFYVEQMLWEEIIINQIEDFDSVFIMTKNQIKISDTSAVSAKIELQNDEDIVNNSIEKNIIAGFNQFTLLLNEIMIRTNFSNEQWIELYNNSDSTINLKNWLIGNGSQDLIITQNDFKIPSHEFVVLAEQNSQIIFDEDINPIYTDLPNFNNEKDEVAVYDYRKVMIDSMKYEYSGDAEINISLERINLQNESFNKSNWQNCLNSIGNTAGKSNSIESLTPNDFGDIIITEIMFNPSENNSEFIEIYNTKGIPIELGGWKIKIDENLFTISDYSFMFGNKTYFVVSADSLIIQNYSWLPYFENKKIKNVSSLGLTNTGKNIYLIDNRNKIIDSVFYSSTWHNSAFLDVKNISLELINVEMERIKSFNWSSCVNKFGGTPGKQNSIFIDKEVSRAKLKIFPNPFSPDNDGHEDFSIISYNLKEPISQIRIRIYDSKGRIVRNLANNLSSGSSGEIMFNGLDDQKNPLKIGIYVVLFEAVNTRNSVVESLKDVVVVARKL